MFDQSTGEAVVSLFVYLGVGAGVFTSAAIGMLTLHSVIRDVQLRVQQPQISKTHEGVD